MKTDICDYDEENVMVCWSIDAGRTYIHFTSSLSELLRLRETCDEMINQLMKILAKKQKKAKKNASHK